MEQNKGKKNIIQYLAKVIPMVSLVNYNVGKVFLKNKVKTDLHLEYTKQKFSCFFLCVHSKISKYFFYCGECMLKQKNF